MIADLITCSRMLFSLLLFVLPLPSSSFAVLYLLCGVSDVLDGFAARRLHTESERGAMLDSAADLLFALVYAVRILPRLSVPLWIWIWTALIAAAKGTGIFIAGKKTHRIRIPHSVGNQITGLLLFFLPLSVRVTDVRVGGALVCIAATGAVTEEICRMKE